MRSTPVVIALAVVALSLCGCPRETEGGGGGTQIGEAREVPVNMPPDVQVGTTGGGGTLQLSNDPTAAIDIGGGMKAVIPPCMPGDFAIDRFAPKVAGHVDLTMDGVDECIVGYQFTEVDDLGEPTEAAYFALLRYDGNTGHWQEWFSIPAPGDERFVDEESILAAGDINDDGIAELMLRYYGFGVSARPETLYIWQIIDDELTDAVAGGCVEMSSDDVVTMGEFGEAFPGPELLLARADMGDEAHADAHHYILKAYGWIGDGYAEVGDARTDTPVADPGAALADWVQAQRR
ncbi:MAG TPA: hypothetical protein DGT21_17820 [Armatimonadetes bacterium]|jgi:hypothetical protein|nr:hypothetical protein [Armatimonadota bacterium]